MLHAHATESLLRRGGRASPSHGPHGHGEDDGAARGRRDPRAARGLLPAAEAEARRRRAGQPRPQQGEAASAAARRASALGGAQERESLARRSRRHSPALAQEVHMHQRLGQIMREASQSPHTELRASIVGAEIDERQHDRHVEFNIEFTMQVGGSSKRYTEFKDLDETLRRRFPGMDIPPLPGTSRLKFWRRTFNAEHIMSKGTLLSEWLAALASIQAVRCSSEFLSFVMNTTGTFAHKHVETGAKTSSRTVVYRNMGRDSGRRESSASTKFPDPRLGGHDDSYTNDPLSPLISETSPSPLGRMLPVVKRRQPPMEEIAVEEAFNSSDAVSSDESDLEEDPGRGNGPAPALIETPWRPTVAHPLLAQTRPQVPAQVSLPGCGSLADALTTRTLILHFERLDVDISFCDFVLDEDGRLRAHAWIDGRQIEASGQLNEPTTPGKEPWGKVTLAPKSSV